MGKNGWLVAVRKAFRHDKKLEHHGRGSKWVCGRTSSSLEEEEETDATMAIQEKLSEAMCVPIKDVKVASTRWLSPPKTEITPTESVPESTTEPMPVSPGTQDRKPTDSVSDAIKEDCGSKTIEEQIKEAKPFETVLIPIGEEKAKLAENVSGRSSPTKEVRDSETESSPTKDAKVSETIPTSTKEAKMAEMAFLPPLEEESRLPETGDEQSKRAYSVAIAMVVAAEAATAAARAAVQIVRLATASMPRIQGMSKEDLAAIKIQSVFRGYLVRRALRALRGLEILKSLIEGSAAKRQSAEALQCVQNVSRVRSQVRSRRMKMSEENQALQHQMLLKQQKEFESLKPLIGDGWDRSHKSKEQLEATLAHRQDAAIRREKALAYAFTRQQQWRNSIKLANPTLLGTSNPNWGWNWVERWMDARPWENRSVADQSDAASVRTASHSAGQITKSHSTREKESLPAKEKASGTTGRKSTTSRKPKLTGHDNDEHARSTPTSSNSQRIRRHSISNSAMGENESTECLPTSSRGSSMPPKSAKPKSSSETGRKPNTAEKTVNNSGKKRLSFSDFVCNTPSSTVDGNL